MERGFGVVCNRRYRDQVPVLPDEKGQMHALGRDGGCVCRVVIGCAQPAWRKIASTDPKMDWFTMLAGHCVSKVAHFINVTMTQTVYPSTVMEFCIHQGMSDVDGVVFSGKWQSNLA